MAWQAGRVSDTGEERTAADQVLSDGAHDVFVVDAEPVDEEDEDPRAELVRRLLEYEQIRDVSQRLRAAEADRSIDGEHFGVNISWVDGAIDEQTAASIKSRRPDLAPEEVPAKSFAYSQGLQEISDKLPARF